MVSDRSIRQRKGATCFLLGFLNILFLFVFNKQEDRRLGDLYTTLNSIHEEAPLDNYQIIFNCQQRDNIKILHPDLLDDMYFYSTKVKQMHKCAQVGIRCGYGDDHTTFIISQYFPIGGDKPFNFLEQSCAFEKILHLPVIESTAGDFIKTIAVQQQYMDKKPNQSRISQGHFYFREAYQIEDVDRCQQIAENKLDGGAFFVVLDKEYNPKRNNYSLFAPSVCNRTNTVYPISVMSMPRRPLILFNKKVQFSAFYFVASTNEWIGYIYDKILMNRCPDKFNMLEFKQSIHNCSAITYVPNLEKDPFQVWSFRYSFEDIHRGRTLIKGFSKAMSARLLQNFLDKVSLYMKNHLQTVSDSRLADLYEIKFTADQDLFIYIDEVILQVEQPIVSEHRNYLMARLYRDSMQLSKEYLKIKLNNYIKYLKRETIPLSQILIDKQLPDQELYNFHQVK